MEAFFCQHCKNEVAQGTCTVCNEPGFCSETCFNAACHRDAACSIPLGVNTDRDGPTVVAPSRTSRGPLIELGDKASTARAIRDVQVRTAMLREWRTVIVPRERTRTQALLNAFNEWVDDVNEAFMREPQHMPPLWNTDTVKTSLRTISQRANAAGISWTSKDEVARHLDALDKANTLLLKAFGAETSVLSSSNGIKRSRDALADAIAERIVLESLELAPEFMDMNTPVFFANIGDDPPTPRGRSRMQKSRDDLERATDMFRKRTEDQLNQVSSEDASFVRRIGDQITAKLTTNQTALGTWAKARGWSVVYGLAILTATGVFVWWAGRNALSTLEEAKDTIHTSADTIKSLAHKSSATVSEVQADLYKASAALGQSAEYLADYERKLRSIIESKPTASDFGVIGKILAEWRDACIKQTAEMRNVKLSEAQRSFDQLTKSTFDTFKMFTDKKIAANRLEYEWDLFTANLSGILRNPEYNSAIDTLKSRVDVALASLGAAKMKLDELGVDLKKLYAEGENITRQINVVREQEAIYLTKAPFTAYLMSKMGGIYGGGVNMGAAVFYTTNELMRLHEAESYINVLVGGVDDVLRDGMGALFTNVTLFTMLDRTAKIVGGLVSVGLRAISGGTRLLQLLASRFGLTNDDDTSIFSVLADFLDNRATDVDNALASIGVVTGIGTTMSNFVTIVICIAKLIYTITAWCTAWWLVVGIAAGAAFYIAATTLYKATPMSLLESVGRSLVAYHWLLAPALSLLVFFVEATADINRGPPLSAAADIDAYNTRDTNAITMVNVWAKRMDLEKRKQENIVLVAEREKMSQSDIDTAFAAIRQWI